MGNTASDRKKEMYISQRDNRRESLSSAPGTPPATARHKQTLVIQQSAEDTDSLLNIDEAGGPTSAPAGSLHRGDALGNARQALRPRATTISHAPDHGKDENSHLPTVFRYKGQGKQVYIAGSFNNWKTKIPLTKSQNDFVTILDLPEGQHEYKFFVDGQWVLDPDQKHKEGEAGAQNNVVEVSRSDFEVFDALSMDGDKAGPSGSTFSSSPPGSYIQEIPNKKPYESSSGPPVLPPHLMQVILNRDIPVTYEPTLLPEPNHVMLNHLYALSIKDGVMVLSATHRYRKKYVTTLMYKPI
ncbi:5'-AMP-activated protein kinase subunit beta-1 [Hypsibius exemplaris]|uniref:5'-AMP-activated protein kinase subunit beta-1 n=1 Tax=Hypsibius exemplaris TaxID=2072580 RepID=A0A1W0W8J8_HYPEX|nr:5'-AMP-activated protein kinase subunit beta-1 [Hypsibius exemplaris]